MRVKGKINKNMRITTEKAYYIIHETVINYDWEKKMTLSVLKLKSFFYKDPDILEEILEQMEVYGARY